MKNVIAIVGMCGSGKSVASDYLEKIGYKKVYFGGVTMEKLKENNLDVTPENEKMMREKLRNELGMAAYAKILLPRIKEYSKESNTVLDGLYSWDELKILKDEFGDDVKVIAIIADKDIRYDRLSKRKVRPFTKEEAIRRDITEIENLKVISIVTDKEIRYNRLAQRDYRPLTKEEAIKRDLSEIENIKKAGPIAYADYYILNNGSIEEYEKRLNEILETIRGDNNES